ncbi:rod shape-determining protein RodA [Sphingorhabdus sp.]|jgi:rod shape determining protein RodA|uniref:rod shape-determining protein RodA n=2 Tax=Sphingorhabdus sp. TaxID=1902408 RepID=UPI003BAEB58A|nr:rod shape-determining protein RodA [Sphingomonadales bacterium]MBK9433164.1 rod shape-determining protein RodA [Sphingomonadales bacterium]MBL0021626.1 rod shape-determining protein RodA [Sphingomonadales bacterium]
MNSIIPAPIASLPWKIILVLSALACFGATVLFSAAGGSFQPWAGKHLMRFCIFLAMAIVMSRFPLTFWKRVTFPVYGVLFVLLLIVEFVGFVGGGSQRWVNLGFMTLQPSELMKPAVVLALAWYYDQLPPAQVSNYKALFPPLLIMGLPWFFVAAQPDLGTSIAILFGGIVVAFVAGLPMRWFVGAGAVLMAIIPLGFFFGLREYQRNRVLVFLNPENDPLGTGYHISQSKIAIGSGGFFGKGFLNGTQSHLEYLPEGHTDFVFATMAEEWGMMGGLFVLFLFYLLIRWGLTVGLTSRSRYGQLVAIGLTATIFFYIMINLMMVMGLAPVVGIPLPFISHGGSSMMTIMICVGIIMSIERHPERRTFS